MPKQEKDVQISVNTSGMGPSKVDSSLVKCACTGTVCVSVFDRVGKGCSVSYYSFAAAGAAKAGGQSDNCSTHKGPNALWVLPPGPSYKPPTSHPLFSILGWGFFFLLWLSALYLISQLGEATKILCPSYSKNQQINHSWGQSVSAAHAYGSVSGCWLNAEEEQSWRYWGGFLSQPCTIEMPNSRKDWAQTYTLKNKLKP